MMLCWIGQEDTKFNVPVRLQGSQSFEKMNAHTPPTEFPPPGYRPTPINHLLVNALDLTAPASDALLKNRKNAWVQLAGHPGSFAPASQNTIWKKRLSKDNYETVAYNSLMCDVVKDIVPKFHREVEYGGEIFIEIEDLLQHFTDPSIMDIKMGTRTFLESEVKNPALRKDMYEKMVKLSPDEPTAKEHEQKGITKLRYMQFRERDSSTCTLGFRIEALKMPGQKPISDLKTIQAEEQVKQRICQFLQGNKDVQKKLLKRFKEMRRKLEASKFFKHHEMIGSSLLILYDGHKHASAWMIDFAKTLHVENHILNHRTSWQIGNHEDGYLVGLDNLIRIFSEMDLDSYPLKHCEPLLKSSGTNTMPECTVPPEIMHNDTTKSNTKDQENVADFFTNSIESESHLQREGSNLSQEEQILKRRKSNLNEQDNDYLPQTQMCSAGT